MIWADSYLRSKRVRLVPKPIAVNKNYDPLNSLGVTQEVQRSRGTFPFKKSHTAYEYCEWFSHRGLASASLAPRLVASRFVFVYFPLAAVAYFGRANGAHAAGSINMRQKKETHIAIVEVSPRKIYRRGNGSEKRIGARDILFTFFVAGALRNDLFNLACALSGQLSVNNTGISPGN